LAGLILPYFLWPDYLSIFGFHEQAPRTARAAGRLAALAFVVPFSVVLWYVETRLRFDLEDRIGWSVVPFAMLLAFGVFGFRRLDRLGHIRAISVWHARGGARRRGKCLTPQDYGNYTQLGTP
jgi:hypothetical protein